VWFMCAVVVDFLLMQLFLNTKKGRLY